MKEIAEEFSAKNAAIPSGAIDYLNAIKKAVYEDRSSGCDGSGDNCNPIDPQCKMCNPPEEEIRDLKHIDEVRRAINSWPKWKKDLLGQLFVKSEK